MIVLAASLQVCGFLVQKARYVEKDIKNVEKYLQNVHKYVENMRKSRDKIYYMKHPTKKQTILLKFIDQYTEEHDYSPSYREIMRAMNLSSVSAVAEHINNCVSAGFLKKVPNAARSLKVIPIQDYKETKTLFRQKITELEAKMKPSENEEGDIVELSDSKRRSLEDDLRTLKAAANLLDLDL